jgi:protein TonB
VPAAAAAPEFGVELAGASGPGGIAVPVGNPNASPTHHAAPKELKAEPAIARDTCVEAASKPKPLQVSQPAFPEEARAAGIQGRVRVELTVDATGAVTQAKVVEGLGHGLDEAAIEAARTYRFEPALRCGKAVSATFTISIRFTI